MSRAHIEQRGNQWCVVLVDAERQSGAVVGRHAAKYKAQRQADDLNDTEETP